MDDFRSRWRPRFTVLGLLLLTLFVALCAGLFVQHRQLRQADEILASHGLKWDRPIGEDEFRLNVVFQHENQQTNMRMMVLRIQTTTPATFTTEGNRSFLPIPLSQLENKMYVGEYFIQSQLIRAGEDGMQFPDGSRLAEISHDYAASEMGNSGSGGVSFGLDVGDAGMAYGLEPLAKSGIYKRGTPVPIYKRYGNQTDLLVK